MYQLEWRVLLDYKWQWVSRISNILHHILVFLLFVVNHPEMVSVL